MILLIIVWVDLVYQDIEIRHICVIPQTARYERLCGIHDFVVGAEKL
ncbi:MAG: hypothetical protein V1891_00520 [bacterium]